ncbi:TRAP transporter small permease [Oryzicola mucosus]|uniref:TRAP transporter small permease protein n=1 Tax=Oryzicola mucosus TaxID=2767425 RepID=A0A8J6PRV9_9HYPH|nr:TRAP transporter small permease [Oryzicola mucosus]MBD0417210.1 TRAP transporter small permease [Oryzicola mucosus]
MKSMEARLRAASHTLALLGFVGLLGLSIMISLDVLLRWLAGMPLQGVNDVSAVVMAVVISACIPANLAMKQNISVEVAGAMLGGGTKRALDTFASLVTLVFIVLMAWQFVPYTMNLHANGDRTWVLAWPVWPWWAVASAMIIFAAVVQFLVFVADFAALIRGDADRFDSGPEGRDPHL